MTRLTLNEALRLQTLRAQALATQGMSFVDQAIIDIAKLRLPREVVRPVIKEISRRKGNDQGVIKAYDYQLQFYPPAEPVTQSRAECESLLDLIGPTPNNDVFPI